MVSGRTRFSCRSLLSKYKVARKSSVLVSKAVITKNHRLGGLDNRNLFSHNSGGQKFQNSVSAGLFSPEVSTSWLVAGCLLPVS